MSDERCGPYVCDFPPPIEFGWRGRWTCPRCGSVYRLTRPKPERWWRRWYAPNGHWKHVVVSTTTSSPQPRVIYHLDDE